MTDSRNDDDVAFIRALAELLNDNGLTELNVKREYGENDSLNVRVSKAPPTVAAATPAPAPATDSGAAARAAAAPAPSQPRAAQDPVEHPGAVISPMVGTAYMSPEPGASPFVTIGTQVSEGQTLLIIEAMKTMNHIPAPRSGTVRRILVSDGSTIEYGAPLMIVE